MFTNTNVTSGRTVERVFCFLFLFYFYFIASDTGTRTLTHAKVFTTHIH